jgi:hypothetical protein
MRLPAACLLALTLLSACSAPALSVTPQIIIVQYTFAARPWLADLYACAADQPGIVLQAEERPGSSLDPRFASLTLRLGAPPRLDRPAYALGEDELVLVVHPKNPLTRLTAAQAAGFFSGRIRNWKEIGGLDLPVQVWAFNVGEDLQQAFQNEILQGSPVTPQARLAQSASEMAAGVASDLAAIGILTGRLSSGSVRTMTLEGRASPSLPILVIVQDEPQGILRDVLACAQK